MMKTALSTSEHQVIMDLIKSPSKSGSELRIQLRFCGCLLGFKQKTFFSQQSETSPDYDD